MLISMLAFGVGMRVLPVLEKANQNPPH